MCLSKPKVTTPTQPEATRYQQSKEPVTRQALANPLSRTSSNERKGGRRSTILASSSAPADVAVAGKKTALGA